MKVLYVTDQFYLHGGIEKMLSQKINHLIIEYGYDVLLCTSEHKNKPFVYSVSGKLRHFDLGVNYDRKKSYFHPLNLLKSISHFKRLNKLVARENPDIIISANYTPEQYFVPFISKSIPKIKEFHSSGIGIKAPRTLGERFKFALLSIFNRYDAQVVLNSDEKKYYPFHNIQIIPNFVEIKKKSENIPREKTVISAGRIAKVKQFDHLIRAWSLIENKIPDWNLKIFGDGDNSLHKQLQQLISELGLKQVYLMGPTPSLNVEMQKASIYAMTSATECFPMVLLEAQAASLPIISYDCPHGPRNIINDRRDGLLTVHNDIEGFAYSLINLINMPEVRVNMEFEASRSVTVFSSEKVMRMWDDLFKELLINKHKCLIGYR